MMTWLWALAFAGADAVADFRVQDHRGQPVALADFKDKQAVLVAFLGVECPLAKQYAGRLAALAKQYEPRGVAFLALDPNEQDGVVALGHFAKAHGIGFPLCKDVGNALADRFGVERVPEVFVLDGARRVAYRGRVDDQYGIGYQRPQPKANHLADALDAVLAGKAPATAKTEAVGCRVGRVRQPDAAAAVTFSKDVAPILNRRCVECHRPGEIGPFSLTNAKDARGWAEMVLEVVEDGRMPPWHADPKHGEFKNDARLSAAEKDTIRRWVRAGAPEGNPADLPPAPKFADGWRIPTPDVVLAMDKAYRVPATGEVRYQYFELPTNFTEDKWISAAEARPGNRGVVHHIIVLVKPPAGKGNTKSGLDSDWLTAAAPGAMPLRLEPGYAKFIPKGSSLVLQMHYTPNGAPQTDRSSVGLVFADPKTVRKEVLTGKAATQRFLLKPGLASQKVEARRGFAEDTLMFAMFPHMHLRGQAFRYELHYPDGQREILLDIPRYDFAWQTGYVFKEPKRIPAGATLHCTALYDNSEGNLSNPDPKARVTWGDQTWEEMMIGYFDMAVADQDLLESRTAKFAALAAAGQAKLTPAMKTAARAAAAGQSLDGLLDALKPALPQLDRIDIIEKQDAGLRIAAATTRGAPRFLTRVKQFARVNVLPQFGKVGAPGDLGPILDAQETVVCDRLSDRAGWDSKALGTAYGSALHVPLKGKDGAPRLVNFYSREPAAFPPAAAKLLADIVQAATEPSP